MAALLSFLLFLLAAAGVAALASRLLASLLRLGLAAAEKTHNDGLVDASLRRGDITALVERRAQVKTLRRSRAQNALRVGAWTALLVAPALAGWGREAYALCSLLWLLPGRPVLPRRAATPS